MENILFGLTGGIACGKSAVTKTFRSLGIPIVDADQVARDVVLPGSEGLSQIIQSFGKEYLAEFETDLVLNRPKLAKLVFSDPSALQKINSIMAPLIEVEGSRQIQAWFNKGYKIVGWDAALILEMGHQKMYRPLIVVSCPQQMQIERLMKRNLLTYEEAMARINSQMPVEEKIKMANFVIDTSGPIENSRLKTKEIALQMRKSMWRHCFDCGRQYGAFDKAIMCEGCGFNNPF
jgi:dephospho-CoA kinase